MIQGILMFLICYICLVVLCLLIYNGYLFNKKLQCAYVVELKNKNPDILVQTKVKILSKNVVRLGTCKIDNNFVEVVLGDEPFDIINTVFFNEKTNKYYSVRKSKKDECFNTTIDADRNIYTYKLKNRDDIFLKESSENFLQKELVMFKNPFENTIFFEDEVNDREIITEIELINKIPKSLDKYFFGGKSLKSLYEVQNKTMFDILKPVCMWVGIVLIISFITYFIF